MTSKELKREVDRVREEAWRAFDELILAAKKGGKRLGAAARRWEMFHHALDRLVGELRKRPSEVRHKYVGKHPCVRHKHHPKDGPCMTMSQIPQGPSQS
jgi:hypothetical protein